MTLDLIAARSYLAALTGSPDSKVTWQWFADRPSLKGDKSLCGNRHGSLAELAPMLTALNERGAGIFVTVNQTDGEGRRSENVTGLRALFIDDDNAQQLKCIVPPNIRVKSKRGEQWYWTLEDGEPLAQFRSAQLALAEHFNTDSSITDLPRVMRVPGFAHMKGEPYPVTLVELNDGGPYTIRGLLSDIGLELAATKDHKPANVKPGPGSTTAYGAAALADEVAKIGAQKEGGRHKAIYAAAAAAGELVAGGHLTEAEAVKAITDAAKAVNRPNAREITDDEIAEAIADGMGKGKASPRGPEEPPPHTDDDQPLWTKIEDGHPTEADIAAHETTEPTKPDRLRAITQAEALALWKSSAQRQCIPTGISALDQAIGGGLPAGQVTTLLGYTGTGKSEFCRQIRQRVADSGTEVVHVDVELGAARILERDLSQASGIPAAILRGGDLSREEHAQLESGEAKIVSQTGIRTISPGGGMPLDLLTKAIDAGMGEDRTKPRLVILDSMQRLASGAKGDSPRIQVSSFSNWVCWYAQTRNVAVLMTSEQHREEKGGRPCASSMLTSGAESRSIEFQADILIGLVPKSKPEEETASPCDKPSERPVDLLIAKNRHGSPGYIQATLIFKSPCWDMIVEKRGATETEGQILAALTGGQMSIREISKAIKRKTSTVCSIVAELVAERRVVPVKSGQKVIGYVLSDRFPKQGNDPFSDRCPKPGNDGKRSENNVISIGKVNGRSFPMQQTGQGNDDRFPKGGICKYPPGDDRDRRPAEDTPLGICIDRVPGEDDDQ